MTHAECVVQKLEVIEHPVDLFLDVLLRAEDVCIVLAELPRAREAEQGPRRLVAVQHGRLGVANRQVAITAET